MSHPRAAPHAMRILIATDCNWVTGGAQTYLRGLVPLLGARGHEVGLAYEVTAPDVEPPFDRALGVASWQLDAPGALAAIEAWKPDVVYGQGLGYAASEEALLARFPVVSFQHNYHATCVSGTKTRHLPTARPCDRVLGPACLAMYLPCRCGGLRPAEMLRSYARVRARQALLPRYRAVCVASAHMREEYRRHGVAEDRLRLLHLFPPEVSPREAPSPAAARPRVGDRVLLMGRITRLKGGDLLVDAMARASKALGRPLTLVLVGDGAERARVEDSARRRGLKVEASGWVSGEAREALFERVDLLAMPSVWPEPFGLGGIELGSMGIPAVAFDVGGIGEWLRPGVSGELAKGDPPTSAGLAEAIARALRDPDHTARLGRGAYAVAREFSAEAHVAALVAILAEAAGASNPR